MVSVIFAVLEVSFWALTTVVKTSVEVEVFNIIFCCFITIFAARCYASTALVVMCPYVCLSVCLSRSYILSKWKIYLQIFSPSGNDTILFFRTKRYSNILTEPPLPNGGVECTWGRQKSGFWPNIWLHRMLWTLRRPAAINTIVSWYPVVCPVVYHSHGASLFTAQKATHQWIRRTEENII